MALTKAVGLGAVAALAIPYVMRDEGDMLGPWLARGVVDFTLAGMHLYWSWPIFCAVTLFAWALFAWANR